MQPPVQGKPWPTWAWMALSGIGAVDCIWLASGPVSLDAASTCTIAALLAFALGLHVAPTVRTAAPSVQTFVFGLGFMLVAWPALRIFNYATMNSALPLVDDRLAGWDAALGLDWLAYVRFVDELPWLLAAMDLTYQGLTVYALVTFGIVLSAFGPRRAREFVLVFFVAAIAATVVGMMFPARAAMAYFAPATEQFQHIRTDFGLYHLAPMQLLRSGAVHTLSLQEMPGLVTFPSFHTAMGVIAILSCRGRPFILLASAAVNGVMIAGTPVFGSHYIVDVFAGIVLALAAFSAVALLETGAAERRRAAPKGVVGLADLADSPTQVRP